MTPEAYEGMELDGAFRLITQIGKGGMGAVYEAEELAVKRRVAVKLILDDGDPHLKQRFLKEMEAALKIEHRNLIPLFRAGFDEKKSLLYMAMRLVKGTDLAHVLLSGALDLERSLRILGNVGEALQCIHGQGYVHRDVKPANILLAEIGQPSEYALLGDLGIAKALDDPAGITKGEPPGTPVYSAPETFKNWVTTPKSDQYSLACVLFEMLAGHPPFFLGDRLEIARQHMEDPAPDLASANPGAPNSVRKALARALDKDPEKRFSTVADFCAAAREGWEAEADEEAGMRRLTPAEVSRSLFGLAPDRDERASQLAMETFLTLWANGYEAPAGKPKSPKRRNGALRSLVLADNFLEGFKGDSDARGAHAEEACAKLAAGRDFSGSEGIGLAQKALRALIDDRTLQGSKGATLLTPFHESLLWYDARRSGAKRPWSVRKVNMRGTGVTIGAMLLRGSGGEDDAATAATAGIKTALKAPTPLEKLTARLREAAPDDLDPFSPEPDELAAWDAAGSNLLKPLAAKVKRHCANITAQEHVAPSAKLLQVRLILALDLIQHTLARSWEAIDAPIESRYLLLSFAVEERKENYVRMASEGSYQSARQQITQAMITELGRRAQEISETEAQPEWSFQFEKRARLDEIADRFEQALDTADFQELAGLVFEESRGSGYGRPVDAFRVLMESVGLLHGTGQYRYLRPGPDLLAALIGAVGGMPMPTADFLEAVWQEWGFVVGDREMTSTVLVDSLDGSLLARNARILERTLASSGLAVALSDQTCMVGRNLGEFR
ncbi:MAG TPA: serine/threonine-protein kinase [Solirubrobacterales bacterium]|nr:serine/threonine-protein kinase [Solirubrobacterales bacterium]